jgi:hypothetical protein
MSRFSIRIIMKSMNNTSRNTPRFGEEVCPKSTLIFCPSMYRKVLMKDDGMVPKGRSLSGYEIIQKASAKPVSTTARMNRKYLMSDMIFRIIVTATRKRKGHW